MIAVLLVGFVVVTTGVVARRVYGVKQQRAIQHLQSTRDALVAERQRLESAIRDASSRTRLQPIAEQQLNMHIPKPDQQVYLKRPTSAKPAATVPPHDSL
ncbi:MAG: cell division protein FtsL [Gemmatimonadaceae bacterium]